MHRWKPKFKKKKKNIDIRKWKKIVYETDFYELSNFTKFANLSLTNRSTCNLRLPTCILLMISKSHQRPSFFVMR
jgi:hypothetical protein